MHRNRLMMRAVAVFAAGWKTVIIEAQFYEAQWWVANGCVVVKYEENDAFVITAYLTDKPKAGEDLWPIK
jgi:hypothetical protein